MIKCNKDRLVEIGPDDLPKVSNDLRSCINCTHFCYSAFQSIGLVETARLDQLKKIDILEPGEMLYGEDSDVEFVFCIYSGVVMLIKACQGRQVMQVCSSGVLLGMRDLIAHQTHSETAIALTRVEYCLFSAREVDLMFSENQDFREYNIESVVNHSILMEKRWISMIQDPVRVRVAIALLELQRIFLDEKNNPRGIIYLSRRDLASYCGTVKETLLRTLKEFKQRGIIKTNHTAIEVLNISELVKLASAS